MNRRVIVLGAGMLSSQLAQALLAEGTVDAVCEAGIVELKTASPTLVFTLPEPYPIREPRRWPGSDPAEARRLQIRRNGGKR